MEVVSWKAGGRKVQGVGGSVGVGVGVGGEAGTFISLRPPQLQWWSRGESHRKQSAVNLVAAVRRRPHCNVMHCVSLGPPLTVSVFHSFSPADALANAPANVSPTPPPFCSCHVSSSPEPLSLSWP